MIIDSKAPRTFGTGAQGESSSSSVATSHSSRLNDLPLPELSGNSSPRVTGDSFSPPPRAYNSIHNELPAFDEEHPNDEPPPAYESIAASPASRRPSRRVLRRPASGSTSTSSYRSNNSQVRIDTPEHTSPSDPTKPSSPCFQRPVPEISASTTTYERLPQPFVIQAKTSKHKLPDLFATVGIPALRKHDVREEDWEYLLQEVVTCARFSSGQRVVAGVLPITRCLGAPGCLASLAVERGMRKPKLSKVFEALDTWNERFFRPRKLEILLCKGDKCKSGRRAGFLAPDRVNVPPTSRPNTSSSHASGGYDAGKEDLDKAYRLVVVSISS